MSVFYYEGLSCPVCAKPFAEGDDIVVCPQCGLPHHRACWTDIGRCYEEDKHGTPQQWSREHAQTQPQSTTSSTSSASTNTQICPQCQTENVEYAEFCTRCGYTFHAKEWSSAPQPQPAPVNEYSPYGQPYEAYSSQERIHESNAADLAAVVGTNTIYYMERFRRIEQKRSGGWNWAAFLLAPYWLFYRKQYGLGILYFVVYLLCNLSYAVISAPVHLAQTDAAAEAAMMDMVESPLFLPVMAVSAIFLVLQILLGYQANRFYLHHCEKRIATAREKTPDLTSGELTSFGGVSIGLAALLYVAASLIIRVVTMLCI